MHARPRPFILAIVSLCVTGCATETIELFPDLDAGRDDVRDLDTSAPDMNSTIEDMTSDASSSEDQDANPDMPNVPVSSVPSCLGIALGCGQDGADDCCRAARVPGNAPGGGLEGESFFLDFYPDGSFTPVKGRPGAISDIEFDVYEVNVARFRAFVADYDRWRAEGNPVEGAGAAATGGGWTSDWDAFLPTSAVKLSEELECDRTFRTWTPEAGPHESLPINCASWAYAFAFCVWDGGRLPTQTEWLYAAAGGSEQRAYPWSDPPDSTKVDRTFAAYQCDNDDDPLCTVEDILAPGSLPLGLGRWGHADLSGNVAEWVLDGHDPDNLYPGTVDVLCTDCITPQNERRLVMGGHFKLDANSSVRANRRAVIFEILPGSIGQIAFETTGIRCARPL